MLWRRHRQLTRRLGDESPDGAPGRGTSPDVGCCGNINHDNGGGNDNVVRITMKDAQGMPGTCGGLGLRIAQFAFALASLSVVGSTNDFPSVTAFRHLVAAVGLQCLWNLLMALIDVYAILVRRSLRNCRIVSLFAVGNGITSILTFAAACVHQRALRSLSVNDLDRCALNHCARFESATVMAFVSWFAALMLFLVNFWSLASR